MLLNQKYSKRKDSMPKGATVKNQDALKNIVNVGANENISSNFQNINKNIFGIIVNNKTIFKDAFHTKGKILI